jgi:outer membrane immunogenic protein
VYGIEGDFSGLSGDISRNIASVGALSTKVDWLSTVRGRAGVAMNNVLLYVTGGVAFADVENSLLISGIPEASTSNTRVGWTVGGGAEYMFTPNWIGRLEFLYADLGHQNAAYSFTGFTFHYTSNLSQELMIGRVGLAYKW